MVKIKDKINNNDKVKLIKELWSNKKTRAWVGLGFYFVFFLILSIMFRIRNSYTPPDVSSKEATVYDIKTIMSSLETMSSDYKYTLMINDYEINGEVDSYVNTFQYQDNNYIFVNNKLYLDNDLDLELVTNFLNSKIPIEQINLSSILKNIKDRQYDLNSEIAYSFNIIYEIPSHLFMVSNINEQEDLNKVKLILTGTNNKVNKITINYDNDNYVLQVV